MVSAVYSSLKPFQEIYSSFSGYLTLESLLVILLISTAGWLANKISNFLIEREVKRRGASEHAIKSSKKVSAYFIYPATFIAILGALGVPLTGLGAAVGLIGLGLSFALKDMIANFISGIMILINQPFKIGDQIKISNEEGTLRDIRLRASEIKTYDGRKVIVPNSQLYNNTVINNTAYDERRFEVLVGIGYEENIEEAKNLAKESLKESQYVEEEPSPQVLVDELGGSSVDLKLRGWTKPSRANMVEASSDVTKRVKQKYDEAGIDIPYPIRTVFLNEE